MKKIVFFLSLLVAAFSMISCSKDNPMEKEMSNNVIGYGWKQEKCWYVTSDGGKEQQTALNDNKWYYHMYVGEDNITFFHKEWSDVKGGEVKVRYVLPYSIDANGLQCVSRPEPEYEEYFFHNARIESCSDSELVMTTRFSQDSPEDSFYRLEYRKMSSEELDGFRNGYTGSWPGRWADVD